jgi:folylpolyglutamate synthase/dihydropteroate synthase
VQAGRHQPRDVRDIGHQQGAHLLGDGAEAREVDHPAVGAGATDDQLRPLLVCGSLYLIGDLRAELRRRYGVPADLQSI